MPLEEFKLVLDALRCNGLVFFLILGWVELNPEERKVHLGELLDSNIIPEILLLWDVGCFDPKLYSFEVGGGVVDRVGKKPAAADVRKKTWPLLTLLLTTEISWRYEEDPEVPHDIHKGDGIYFHKILDHFRWMKPIRFPDGWRGHDFGRMCAWDGIVYFVGSDNYKADTRDTVWTLDIRYY